MKSVTFCLSFLISLVPDLVSKREKFKKSDAARRKPTHSFVTEILNTIIGCDLIRQNVEIDQDKISDTTVLLNIRRKILAFLLNSNEELTISLPGRTRRRSHGQLAPTVQTRAPKQTRLQSSKCDSLNCEWKKKLNDVTDENNELKQEVATLKIKLDSLRSQSSQESSQQSTQTNESSIRQSSIPLLEVEQDGSVRRYSSQMFRLAIILIVACNLSCEVIPDVLSAILTAAQIRHLDLPKTGFFLKIRSMLRPLNEKQVQSFCDQAERITICFDESSFKTKIGQILAISVMNEKAEQKIVSLVEHNERSSTVKKHLIDVKVIMAALTDSLGDFFKPTMLKTNMIMSDNCHAARSTREALKKELDDKYPVTFERHSQKCLVHVSNLSETFILKELPLLEPRRPILDSESRTVQTIGDHVPIINFRQRIVAKSDSEAKQTRSCPDH